MPTKIAIHGHDSKVNLHALGMPDNHVIYVEALRYLYLSRLTTQQKKINHKNLEVIVLTGLDEDLTIYQCKFMMQFIANYPEYADTHFLIKPHPALVSLEKITKKYCQGLNYSLTETPFSDLDLSQTDFALIENSSTVAMECLYMRLPFCLMNYPGRFNLSSLLRHKALFVKTPAGLKQFIEDLPNFQNYMSSILQKEGQLFYLDQDMHRWQRILRGEI